MRVPVKLIADLVNFRLPSVSDLTDSIGSKLGEVDNVIDLAQKYQDAVIVKVIECHKIDQSDHLNLCLVDDNHFFSNVDRTTSGFIQVVCGASNVKPGLLTVWLTPKTPKQSGRWVNILFSITITLSFKPYFSANLSPG